MIRHHRAPEPPPISSTSHYRRDIIPAPSAKPLLRVGPPPRLPSGAGRAGLPGAGRRVDLHRDRAARRADHPSRTRLRSDNARCRARRAGGPPMLSLPPSVRSKRQADHVFRLTLSGGMTHFRTKDPLRSNGCAHCQRPSVPYSNGLDSSTTGDGPLAQNSFVVRLRNLTLICCKNPTDIVRPSRN